MSTIDKKLDIPFLLSEEQIGFYQENRFIKIKQVLDEETVGFYNQKISVLVDQINTETRKLEERDTYGKAFLQLFNLWQKDAAIQKLVFSKRLAGIAAQLMQVTGVRLYHDQALFKEAGGGITPWHADQYYWPLASDHTVTAWIPLQQTPMDMGPLEFSAGSHRITEGRELAISDDSEVLIGKRLRVTDFPVVAEPFDLGEVSFHSGWIFHRAGGNSSNQIRKVMTVIYMDKNMRLKQPENDGQQADWDAWCPGAPVGDIIDTPLNPILI
ncbi:MAG: phytanoyl-CoA dioxygenase family protein [Saprospiraceae bacterium]|nr:phytanoyl-CoA dioxygenase family protein [Saprospiraceae bacterium]MDP4998922.1 phytanoyl-CoA dioxygenase family protein [Saprospiraceae bacterium]